MAVAVKPSQSLINIRSNIKSVKDSFSSINKKTGNVNNILLKKTKVKRESIARNYVLSQRRQEAERRKNREDLIEASSIGGVIKRQGKAVASSTKGFLGRIMDFLGTLLVGWLAYNLPSIITMAQELIARMQRLATIVSGFFNNTKNILKGFGNLLGAVGKNILTFDFNDSSGRVKNAMSDLGSNFDDMQSQFDEGFRLLTTSLGEGLVTGKDAEPFGTQYPNQSMQEQPSAPSGSPGGGETKYPELASMVVKGEGGLNSVNRGNAGDTPGGSKSIFGKDLSEMTVGEIMQAQKEGRVFAVGKYQFIPITLAGAVSYTKTPLNSKFNSATQNKLFDYLIDVKRPEIGAYINGKSNDKRTAIQQLAREFASVGLEYPENGKKRGQSRYSGTGGNRASISPELAGSALDKQRGIGTQKSQKPAPAQTSSAQAAVSTSVIDQFKGKPGGAAGIITSERGMRLSPTTGKYRMHNGIDIAPAGPGYYVALKLSGKVNLVAFDSGGYGNYVDIKSGNTIYRFAHLAKVYVKQGQTYTGQTIGEIGSTGGSTGIHLHFEVKPGGGDSINPRPYLGLLSIGKQLTGLAGQPTTISAPTPAQIASQGTQQRQQVSQQLSQQRNGPTIVVIEEDPPAQQQVSAGGGGGGIIPIIINPLNSFITKKLLLDLAYT
jgi:murein DD-endopeptidase MepM/ murein hydrolase activator NlpD